IRHYVYAGDTALHVAAAVHDAAIVEALLARGADVDAANRRGATALHYATDGRPGDETWSADAQVATIAALVAAGADVDASDADGTTPLLRAVRNRCADAVRTLIAHDANVKKKNKRGSTPWKLANVGSGKSGSASQAAKEQQREIVR